MGEQLNAEALDSLVLQHLQDGAAAEGAPEEQLRALLLAADFGAAAAALRRLCPALADNQWLQFQLKKHQFMRMAALAASEGEGSREARVRQLQDALDLAKRDLAPLALHAYVEAFADFKHCMLVLVSGAGDAGAAAASGSGAAGQGGSDAGAASTSAAAAAAAAAATATTASSPARSPNAELREFAGMVARAVRQHRAGSSSAGGTAIAGADAAAGPAGGGPAGGLLQLLRYLLLLHQHQHHSGFHPFWWPETSAASLEVCKRLLLPQRDPLPPSAMGEGAVEGGLLAMGVREQDVQALRTSLGCDREEAVALLRRAGNHAFRGLQDALQATHIDGQLLQELTEEYAVSRGLDLPLPLAAKGQAAGGADAAAAGGPDGGDAMQVDGDRQQQEQQGEAGSGQESKAAEAEEGRQQRRPSKVARKEAAAGGSPGKGTAAGVGSAAGASPASGPAGQEGMEEDVEQEEPPLELPAELSEQQLRQVTRHLERQLAAGHADLALRQLEAADPSFLADNPALAFALHRCCFLKHLAPGGEGTAAALAVVRQHMSPLAQQHPELLQPQLKASLAQLLPLTTAKPPADGAGGEAGAVAAAAAAQQKGAADALSALRAALRRRCHLREPRLLTLLRELLSLHAAHFKLQRCQDRFASDLGISALKALAPSVPAAPPAAAAAAGGTAAAAPAAAAGGQQPQQREDVPVPGVRVVGGSSSEDEEMRESSDDDDDGEDGEGGGGVGVPEQAILTVCEFTGLPRHTAIELLLVHGGDATAVLAHMFP